MDRGGGSDARFAWRALMPARLRPILCACALIATAAAAVPVAASASVKVYDKAGQVLATIEKAKCRQSTNGSFKATSLPGNAPYVLEATIGKPMWEGFRHHYPVFYGDTRISVDLFGPGSSLYSNFPLPGTPPSTVVGGAINFDNGGKQVGVGLDPALAEDLSTGLIIAGVMKCKYPRRR
jgi:hypothetical protein